MKAAFIILCWAISIGSHGQTKKNASPTKLHKAQTSAPALGTGAANETVPRQTATERYLNGPSRRGARNGTSPSTTAGDTSPFFGGVHGADATKRLDTAANQHPVNNTTVNNSVGGGRDTTFNVNTLSQGGVTTNSGAVDRSGQAQFGQTNWGNSRSTVGESQWTIPPPITASFNRDFPTSNNATWTRSNTDSTIYSARYQSGTQWVITNYNASGQRLDIRTAFPLLQPPRSVSVYIAKQAADFRVVTIYKLQVQGRPDVYEVETASGKKLYINNDGVEVQY